MKFWGYRRINGTVGVRNHVLIFPTTICASTVAGMISKGVSDTVSVVHRHGCGHLGEEKRLMVRTMAGFCANPNIAGVLLVGLGCELLTPDLIANELAKTGKRFEIINIQTEGGTTNSVAKGVKIARQLSSEVRTVERELIAISELILGISCGGSDALSGLTANSSLGVACDLLVAKGGTVIFSETPEMLGAEHILVKRAANSLVKNQIWTMIRNAYNNIMSQGVDVRGAEPSPGNIAGGITTLEEKSLGAIVKGGISPIVQVVDFAEKPKQKGLVIMDGPAHDVVCNSGMLAAGAQVIIFSTGRGTPIGSAIAPVIKVSSNSELYNKMKDNIDVNAGTIIDGMESVQAVGERLLTKIVGVASGKLTRAEILGHCEFAIPSIIPTL